MSPEHIGEHQYISLLSESSFNGVKSLAGASSAVVDRYGPFARTHHLQLEMYGLTYQLNSGHLNCLHTLTDRFSFLSLDEKLTLNTARQT